MQVENETFLNFSRRTDELAARLGMNIEDLPQVIGISRASLFCYRTGKRQISGKAWAKLFAAEQRVSKSITTPMVVSEEASAEYGSRAKLSEMIVNAWQRMPPRDQIIVARQLIQLLADKLDR